LYLIVLERASRRPDALLVYDRVTHFLQQIHLQ